MQSRKAPPTWVLAAGAALAACLATLPPGLALFLEAFYRRSPDLQALLPELVVGVVMGAFGALQLRAQLVARARWVGAPFVVLNVGLVFAIGLAFDVGLTAGSTDTGPALVIGFFLVLAVAIGNAVLAAITWLLLVTLAKRIAADPGQARARAGRWVIIAAAVHVAIKAVSGGPVLFGVIAAGVGFALLWPLRRSHPSALLAISGVVALIGCLATAAIRVRIMVRAAHSEVALCTYSSGTKTVSGRERATDVLAVAARQVPGVADAASDVKSLPNARFEVTVFVMPRGGGPLAAPLEGAVQRAIAAVKCTESSDGSRPDVLVKSAIYVPLVIAAKVKVPVEPSSADAARLRTTIENAVRKSFDDPAPIRSRDRSALDVSSALVEDGGVLLIDFRVGEERLSTRLAQMEPGSVAVVERIDVNVN